VTGDDVVGDFVRMVIGGVYPELLIGESAEVGQQVVYRQSEFTACLIDKGVDRGERVVLQRHQFREDRQPDPESVGFREFDNTGQRGSRCRPVHLPG